MASAPLTSHGESPASSSARTSLDLALYDVRFETDAGALVLASLLAAVQRGVAVRLLYNVAHPGPIPVPPPPETAPDAIEALPVDTRGIAGIPDLMHHKFVVRDGEAVWTGSTNWTDDSWSRQENVIATVEAREIAYAYTLAFEQLWDSGDVERTGRSIHGRRTSVPLACGRGSRRARRGAVAPHREAPRQGDAADPDRIPGADVRPDPRRRSSRSRRSSAAISQAWWTTRRSTRSSTSGGRTA